ncbi:MAG: DNA replication and repair protein RecF [Firmicutes bacterium ADurb.Bin193]|nr:MAG: DNA replication and repair protein RecF [Firmicutes bacterium ADurb.Bin193]
MKLTNARIRNYRLLENCTIRIDQKTTILVGKNNSGKTSFSYLFETFLKNTKEFTFDDFSIACHQKFISVYNEYLAVKDKEDLLEDYFSNIDNKLPAIELELDIEYGKDDNWSNIRPLLTTLDNNNILHILFAFKIKEPKKFFDSLTNTISKLSTKKQNNKQCILGEISKVINDFYGCVIKPIYQDIYTDEVKYADIQKIISSYFIAAQRQVEDSNSKTNSKLAPVFQREYKNCEKTKENKTLPELEKLLDTMDKANGDIDTKLASFFRDFTASFSTFGYPNMEGSDLILKSNVTLTNLFSGIQLFYKDQEHLLPERYNGLGYSNLIYIISEILCFRSQIKELNSDLNLIFIEEPEAHMHPQLQNTFITKLSEFMKQNGINAQVIISTHSPHIVSNAKFENIRYFNRNEYSVTVKDLLEFEIDAKKKEIHDEPFDEGTIEFLKQYITLVKCDMFFADKIILVEGLCERLLMPLFLMKIDTLIKSRPEYQKLRVLSEQYIAIIEIGGAYMFKFKEFLEFLGIKTLIITDVDSCLSEQEKDKDGNLVFLKDGKTPKMTRYRKKEITSDYILQLVTSNQTLIKWLPGKKMIKELIFSKFNQTSKQLVNVSFQRNTYNTKTNIKCGRTFEEAFIIDNARYMFNMKDQLESIKSNISDYKSADDILNNSYNIYEYIDTNNKKSDFAFDLMYISSTSWSVPTYIEEGLIWLAK